MIPVAQALLAGSHDMEMPAPAIGCIFTDFLGLATAAPLHQSLIGLQVPLA